MAAKTPVQRVRVPSSYDDTFLTCRDFGHAWEDDPTETPTRSVRRAMNTIGRASVGRAVQCLRCQMVRTDWISPDDGAIVSRHYRQVEGYRIPGSTFSKATMRKTRLRRLGVLR